MAPAKIRRRDGWVGGWGVGGGRWISPLKMQQMACSCLQQQKQNNLYSAWITGHMSVVFNAWKWKQKAVAQSTRRCSLNMLRRMFYLLIKSGKVDAGEIGSFASRLLSSTLCLRSLTFLTQIINCGHDTFLWYRSSPSRRKDLDRTNPRTKSQTSKSLRESRTKSQNDTGTSHKWSVAMLTAGNPRLADVSSVNHRGPFSFFLVQNRLSPRGVVECAHANPSRCACLLIAAKETAICYSPEWLIRSAKASSHGVGFSGFWTSTSATVRLRPRHGGILHSVQQSLFKTPIWNQVFVLKKNTLTVVENSNQVFKT